MDTQAADTRENWPSGPVAVGERRSEILPAAADDDFSRRLEDSAKTTVTNRWPLKDASLDLAARLARLHVAIAQIAEVCERHGVMLACESDLCFRLFVTDGRTVNEVCEEIDGSLWVAQHACPRPITALREVAFPVSC